MSYLEGLTAYPHPSGLSWGVKRNGKPWLMCLTEEDARAIAAIPDTVHEIERLRVELAELAAKNFQHHAENSGLRALIAELVEVLESVGRYWHDFTPGHHRNWDTINNKVSATLAKAKAGEGQ